MSADVKAQVDGIWSRLGLGGSSAQGEGAVR